MATVAEYTIRSDDFPLGRAFADLPEASIEVDRLRHDAETMSFNIWITGSDASPYASELIECDGLNSVIHVDSFQNEHLFYCEWNPDREGVVVAIGKSNLRIESVSSSPDSWKFRLRAESSRDLTEFQAYCIDHGFSMRLSHFPMRFQIFNGREYNITEKQHEALVLAYTNGYFDKPREITLEELASPLGISQEALIARLRTGQRNLLENTIVRSVNSGP